MALDAQSYIESLGQQSAALLDLEWNDPHQLFGLTLRAMNKDALRWVENEWRTPQGSGGPPIERAVVVLTQDMIVLLGHAHNLGLEHATLRALRVLAEQAVVEGVIEDAAHRAHFEIVDREMEG